MPIKPFSFPHPETRFFHSTKYVYKFKIRYGIHFCSEDTENSEKVMSELFDSLRAILANHDNLQPFSTKHFLIFPYKSKWGSACRLKFKHGPKFLQPFPYVFTVYVEPYASVCETQAESSREKDSQSKDEEIQDKEDCMKLDHEEYHISDHSDHPSRIPCPTPDHDSQEAGGLMEWLKSSGDTCRQFLAEFGREVVPTILEN